MLTRTRERPRTRTHAPPTPTHCSQVPPPPRLTACPPPPAPAAPSPPVCSFKIDGDKVILLRGDDPEVRVEEATFEAAEVYGVDVIVSSGDGKPRDTEARTTVYKLALESSYKPRMKASQQVLREAGARASIMPFTLRALEETGEAAARMGIVELARHGNVHPYPVLAERDGVEVAHVKFTVLLLPGGTLKVTGLALPASVQSAKALPADMAELLATVPFVKKERKA